MRRWATAIIWRSIRLVLWMRRMRKLNRFMELNHYQLLGRLSQKRKVCLMSPSPPQQHSLIDLVSPLSRTTEMSLWYLQRWQLHLRNRRLVFHVCGVASQRTVVCLQVRSTEPTSLANHSHPFVYISKTSDLIYKFLSWIFFPLIFFVVFLDFFVSSSFFTAIWFSMQFDSIINPIWTSIRFEHQFDSNINSIRISIRCLLCKRNSLLNGWSGVDAMFIQWCVCWTGNISSLIEFRHRFIDAVALATQCHCLCYWSEHSVSDSIVFLAVPVVDWSDAKVLVFCAWKERERWHEISDILEKRKSENEILENNPKQSILIGHLILALLTAALGQRSMCASV